MRGSRSTAQHYGGENPLLYKESNITTSHFFVGFSVPLDPHMYNTSLPKSLSLHSTRSSKKLKKKQTQNDLLEAFKNVFVSTSDS